MKGLLDLFSRNPTPVRVTTYVERLLVGQREALDLDAYAERLETLRESLLGGILPGLSVLLRSNPSTPSSAKRCCHRHTIGRLTLSCVAIR